MNKFLLLAFALVTLPIYAQTWVQKANIPSGRHHPVTFSLDGKGYSVTGTNSSGQPTDDFYEYDPVTDTWTTLTDFPGAARSFSIGTVVNGIAYLGFGQKNGQYLNDLWSYDAQTDQWTPLANCGCTGRRHPSFIGIGNRIYVGLGNDGSGDLKSWWMYNIDTDAWVQIADLPGPARHHPFHFNAGGEVFAGLGHRSNSIYKDWYKLDTATNTWTAMQQFPGEARVAGTQFDHNGFGYVLSGDGDNHSYMQTGEMWRYSPDTDSWLQLTPHPGVSRWAPGSFVINDEIYFFGGQNRQLNSFPTNLWKYDIASASIGIDEIASANNVIYPNPASNFVSWQLTDDVTNVSVYNMLGELLMNRNSVNENRLDISSLEEGLHILRFYNEEELVYSSKVLVQF